MRPLLTLAALLAASCGDGPVTRAPCPPGKLCLEYGNLSEPGSLDPQRTSGTWESRIVGDLMMGLTQDDPRGRPIPGVASSWTTSTDGLVWTFRLRDSKWSDGRPVTASDFVYGLRRAIDPKTASEHASLLYFIKNAEAVANGRLPPSTIGVRALAPSSLQIRLEHPLSHLPEIMKVPLTYPLPAHVVERHGDKWTQPGRYVSNGPFMLRSWSLGDRVNVVKNPLFWDAATVCIDEINYYPTTDGVSAERRIRRGELDVNTDFQSNRLHHLQRTMPGYARPVLYLSTVYIVFNSNIPAFQDKRVRQALAMAIDNRFITDKLLRAGQRPASSFVTPGTANYPSTAKTYWSTWSFGRRQAEARRLLAAAGYHPSKPLKFEIKFRNQPDAMLFMPAVQADWREIGVEATLLQNETQIAYAAYRLRDFEVADAAYSAEFNDAMSFLSLHHSQTGAQNYGDYNSPEFDRLLLLADGEPNLQKRGALLATAEQKLLDDTPIAPIYYSISRSLVHPNVTGWVDNIVAWHRARYLCFKDAEQRRRQK